MYSPQQGHLLLAIELYHCAALIAQYRVKQQTRPVTHTGSSSMSTQPTNRSSIEQLHRDVAALAEEKLSPAPTATCATLLPFSIGAALALAIFAAAIVVRLL